MTAVAIEVGRDDDLDAMRLDFKVLQPGKLPAHDVVRLELLHLIARERCVWQLLEEASHEAGKAPGNGNELPPASDGCKYQLHEFFEAVDPWPTQFVSLAGAIFLPQALQDHIGQVANVEWLEACRAPANQGQER